MLYIHYHTVKLLQQKTSWRTSVACIPAPLDEFSLVPAPATIHTHTAVVRWILRGDCCAFNGITPWTSPVLHALTDSRGKLHHFKALEENSEQPQQSSTSSLFLHPSLNSWGKRHCPLYAHSDASISSIWTFTLTTIPTNYSHYHINKVSP